MGRWPAVVVAALLVTAGCSGLASGPGGEATRTPTVTPVPLEPTTTSATTQSTTVPPAVLPASVSPDGSVAVGTLAISHREFLDGKSYTVEIRYNATGPNGRTDTFETYDRTVKVVNSSTYFDVHDRETVRTNRTAYVDDTGEYVRIELNNRTTFRYNQNPLEATYFAFLVTDWIRRYLALPDAQVDRIERDDERLVRLYATETPVGLVSAGSERGVENYSITAYVTSEGFLRAMRVEYDRYRDGTRKHVQLRVDYRDVGETTISKPSWVTGRNDTTPDNDSVPTPP